MPWRCFLAATKADRFTPGAMWIDPNGEWAVMLPGARAFHEKEQPTNGAEWTCGGVPPNVSVSPSINYHGIYHGWLRDGVLSDDVEGRRYDAAGRPAS